MFKRLTELVYSIGDQLVYVVDDIFGVPEISVSIDDKGNIIDEYYFQMW